MALLKKLKTHDLADFIKSLNIGLVELCNEYGYDKSFVPKFLYQHNRENKVENFKTNVYEKPIAYVTLLKRTNMSLDSQKMFSDNRALRPIFKTNEVDGVTKSFLKKDNMVGIRVYTKTIEEKLSIQDLLEHLIDEFSKKLKCDLCFLEHIKDVFEDEFAISNELYAFDFVINVRTNKTVEITDNSILETIAVSFEQYTCRYFNGVCTKDTAEKKEVCNVDCAKKMFFCDDFEM